MMEWESTTKSVSMRSLAEQGSVGGLLIRLMMVLQDYAFANQAMTAIGRPSKKKKQGDVKRASGRYYLRLQISHSYEALKIVQEMKDKEDFASMLLSCSKDTKKAHEKLLAFLDHADFKLMTRIRNNISFHYDPAVVLKSLRRVEERRQRQVAKRKNNVADVRKPTDVVNFKTARIAHKSEFVPWEVIENDIVLHDIFKLAESDTHTEDKKLDADADRDRPPVSSSAEKFQPVRYRLHHELHAWQVIYFPDELAASNMWWRISAPSRARSRMARWRWSSPSDFR
jgi:hypothetical protein